VSQRAAAAVLALILAVTALSIGLRAEQAEPRAEPGIGRRVKTKVQPVYPELARKTNFSATVKIEVVVAPNGTVRKPGSWAGTRYRLTPRWTRQEMAV
jgi:hypothetical protein